MIEFLNQEALGLPYWVWFAIILGIACLLIAIIIVACVTKGKAKEEGEGESSASGEQTGEEKHEEVEEEKPAEVKEEKKEEVKEEKPVQKAAAAETSPEKKEPKPAEKKTTAAKSATAKSSPAKTTVKEERSEPVSAKVYHISKRKEDGKWQVKAEGATKALKLFLTQQEAIDYAKKVAGNQEGRIVIHKEGGGFRKLNY